MQRDRSGGCATRAPETPTNFYVSWSGKDRNTDPVAEATGAQLRAELGFKSGFDDALHVHVADGVQPPLPTAS